MKKKIKRPIDVNPYFDEARKFVLNLSRVIPLTSAMLDDWNTGNYPDGEEVIGARIIYGSDKVKYCRSVNDEN